jgi:anti-sigma factor RsiW
MTTNLDHVDAETMSAFLDGDLDAAASATVEAHLAACPPCRTRLDSMRATLAAVARLPRVVSPPPALWHDVQHAVRADARTQRTARAWNLGGLAAAAAIAFVLLRAASPSASSTLVATTPSTLVDSSYTGAIAALRGTVEARRTSMPGTAARTMDRSLAVIDTAIDEARRALVRDPDNQDLVGILSANYQRKLELLQRAADLSSD